MEVAAGILTSRGGMTSHAAVVTRGMGKCCVAGAGDIDVDEKKREMTAKGQIFKDGDWISLDGTTGRVIKGKLNTLEASTRRSGTAASSWDGRSSSAPWAFAPMPTFRAMPSRPRAFGAEGIGLCRTEHMFFGEDRIAAHAGDDSGAQRERPPQGADRSCCRCSARTSPACSKRWTASRSPSARSIRRCTSSCRSAKT